MHRPQLVRCDFILLIIAAISIIGGVVTIFVFPIIYEQQVKSHLQFSRGVDGSLSYASYMWSRPPMRNVMSFYFFNVTNPDEIQYFGATPALVEVGPFAVIESEQKKYMKWGDNGDSVFYENYKIYQISKEESCPTCDWGMHVLIPNSPGLGAAADMFDPQYGVTSNGRIVITVFLLLLGEFPFVNPSVLEILFNGYNDPLLSAAHSNLVNVLSGVLKGNGSIVPIPIPDMPMMGYFQGYNNTQDEFYWVNTGKNDANQLGEVLSWANVTELPASWWTTDYARNIRGSDSGSFSKMQIKKEDVIPMFQSFQCRSFDSVYLQDETIHNIPSYTFSVPYDNYDTTLDENIGFRYRNFEGIDYFPDWPACPSWNPSNCLSPASVNCTLHDNLCNDCCNKSMVDGTYLMPPGIFPLVCYPGRLEPSPFSVMYSPPHFLYSPDQVVNSVIGLNPDVGKHLPMLYSHEPYSGTITRVLYRLQVSMPVFKNPEVPQAMHMANSILPIFWQGAAAHLHEATYNLVWLGFVFVPNFFNALQYILIGFGLFLVVLVFFLVLRRKTRKISPEEENLVAKALSNGPGKLYEKL